MGTKMKGFYRGFKYNLSQIFVVKDREIEIGRPTDVKHVAHVGWEGPGSAPTWMNEFRFGSDSGSAPFTCSSRDFGESMRQQSATTTSFKGVPSPELPTIKKKEKRKKSNSTSSPTSASCSSSTPRTMKLKSKFIEPRESSSCVR